MAINMAPTGIDYLQQKQAEIDRLLDYYLPPESDSPQRLHQAMRYSVLAAGKRIRPILCMVAYETLGKSAPEIINPAACALELVHTYSLIHDDLPCMDDDDLRRGILTLHKKFDEATAVLAGDALHDLAFDLVARSGSTAVVSELANAIGTYGMLGGQMADILAEGRQLGIEDIKYIHMHKTAALIRGSIRIGAFLAEADEYVLERLSLYGEKIGLAFQIIDDILDINGDQKKLGKKVGSDCKNKKATYPGIMGLKQARLEAARLISEAVGICRNLEFDTDNFQFIAEYIGNRDN
nr:polyprenyl synthetase family protein [candidate division Zixibacteria bacterium]